jgi:integrase
LSYLVSNELIKTDPVVLPKLMITDEDLASNPPLNDHDWSIVLKYINHWQKQAVNNPNWRGQWWRYQFRHFVHIAKRSGLRPSELCSLRWCDVEIIDNPKSIQDDARATLRVRKSKTHSSRSVPTNMGRELRRLKQWQTEFIAQYQLGRVVRSEDLIFVDVNGKPYDVPAFSKCWRDYIMPAVVDQLEGDRDYGRNFTLYSLRSSYIDDQLRAGVDVFLLAKACGHSVKTLMRYYERFDTTTREDELAHLPIGEGKKKGSSNRSTM